MPCVNIIAPLRGLLREVVVASLGRLLKRAAQDGWSGQLRGVAYGGGMTAIIQLSYNPKTAI
jgi:hypothetical protein